MLVVNCDASLNLTMVRKSTTKVKETTVVGLTYTSPD